MFPILKSRIHQGYRTMEFPEGVKLPEKFRGKPFLAAGSTCPENCQSCIEACPTQALIQEGKLKIDLGKCLFCPDCQEACPQNYIQYARDFSLSARKREDLILEMDTETLKKAQSLDKEMKRVLGRSLRLRQVSAGGCNACEADSNVLGTIGWDMGRFGIQFVASPRHADGILLTGPVTQNMKLALLKTYEAIPEPKLVIAVGTCAISGGLFQTHPETCSGVEGILPVDLYIPGCPPHPSSILEGLLTLLGRLV